MDLISVDKPYNGMKAKLRDVVYVRRGAGEAPVPPQEVVYVGKGAFVAESPTGELTVYGKNTTGMGIFTVTKVLLVNGFEVPAPLEKDPGEGQAVYLPDPTLPEWHFTLSLVDRPRRALAIARGLAHGTADAAIAHAKAMAGIDPTARKSLDDAYDDLP